MCAVLLPLGVPQDLDVLLMGKRELSVQADAALNALDDGVLEAPVGGKRGKIKIQPSISCLYFISFQGAVRD
jgi:hypothetical protein